ncbi:hypothetical protein B0J17DRAFT_706426 [Rhizoctonia solani]|nr:hypothetical protein B0J17DRAFT_706426 [Rhizoctonia solani]
MLGPSPSPEPSTGSPQKVNRIPESSQTAKPALKRRSFIQRAPTSLGSGPASTMLFVSRVSATATLALPVEYGSLISYEPGMASPNFSKLGSGGFDIQYSTDAKEHEAKLGEIGLGGEDAREHVERTIPPSGNSGSTNLGDSDDSDMESLPPKSIPHPYAPTRHSPSVKANFFGDGKALLAGHPAPLRVSTGFEPGKLFTHRDSNPNLNTSGSDPPVRGSTSHGYPVPIPGYDFGVSKTGERFPLASSPIFSTDSDSDEEIQISEKYRLPNITPLPLEPGSSSGPSYRKRKLGLLLGPKMTSEGNGSQKRSRSDDDKDPLGLLSFSLRGKEKQRDKPVRGAHE